MVESIQFREGVLDLVISLPRAAASAESKRSVQFDFGESGAVAELHRRELVDFLYSVDFERPYQISDLIFELLGAESRVRRVNLDCLYGASKNLKGYTAPDVGIQFTRSAVEGTGRQEEIPF